MPKELPEKEEINLVICSMSVFGGKLPIHLWARLVSRDFSDAEMKNNFKTISMNLISLNFTKTIFYNLRRKYSSESSFACVATNELRSLNLAKIIQKGCFVISFAFKLRS